MEGRQLSIESNLECTRTHTHLELCIAQNHGCTTYCHTGRRVRTSLPVSCQRLLYVTNGNATVILDGNEHATEPFYMLHGGKNTRLDIIPTDESFHYYLIFYKASLPLTGKQHTLQQPDQPLPFHLQYGFIPYHPAILYEITERMLGEWNKPGRLERLHTKTLFYQFVYELLRQMDQQQVSIVRPNLASQLIRYMQEHYAQPLTRKPSLIHSITASLIFPSTFDAKLAQV